MEVKIVQNVMAANDLLAQELREVFTRKNIFVINLLSSPGAGKTSLLEETIKRLKGDYQIAVIEGDIAGDHDARRIAALGIPVVQINTGGTCHLDARMVKSALVELDLTRVHALFIENVGNLVCPASFKLGEDLRAVILSTPEGNDKVKKYPLAFRESQAVVINKVDLLSHVDFDLDQTRRDIRDINTQSEIFALSCKTGEGLDFWVDYIKGKIQGSTLRAG
jgi:hydrogenase nickel incorporation protein HypB